VQAFDKYGGLPAITNNPLDTKLWRPIVQNHFIAAARPPVPISSSELLVRSVAIRQAARVRVSLHAYCNVVLTFGEVCSAACSYAITTQCIWTPDTDAASSYYKSNNCTAMQKPFAYPADVAYHSSLNP
jgi:hypothetical protein